MGRIRQLTYLCTVTFYMLRPSTCGSNLCSDQLSVHLAATVTRTLFHDVFPKVLRGRRPDASPRRIAAPIQIADLTIHEPGRRDDIRDDIIFQKHRVSTDVIEIVERRQNTDLQVPSAEMLQLIDDVKAVEGQLRDWLEGGAPIVTPDGTPTDDMNNPEVSDPAREELNPGIADPQDTGATTPSTESLPSGSCMVTVTETFYEYIYNGPSSVDVGFRGADETNSLEDAPLEATPTLDLSGEGVLNAAPFSLNGDDLQSLPAEDSLIPLVLSGSTEALPTADLADLSWSAPPSITPPPEVTDDAILDEGDVVEDTDGEDNLSREDEAVGNAPVDEENQPAGAPTEISLRFPGEGSEIVWKTISLPS